MTLPSQQPRNNAPLSSGARHANGMRTLFIAVTALGLGGAAAGWFLTHRSEEVATDDAATIVDPLVATGSAASEQAASEQGAAVAVVEVGGTATQPDALVAPSGDAGAVQVVDLGAVAPVAPQPPVGGSAAASTAVVGANATSAAAASGIPGTPGAAPVTPAATLGTPAQRLAQATQMIDGDPVRARAELTRLIDSRQLGDAERRAAYAAVNSVAERVFLSSKIVPGDTVGQSYVVRKGDSLARICSREKLGVDWRFIQRINGMASEKALRPDMRLKLAHGPFHAEVVKSDFVMNIYSGTGPDRVMVLSLPVGLGENDGTPVGSFRVKKNSKLVNPEWRNPRTGEKFAANDPKNPIGERWIGLEGTTPDTAKFQGYGIHGTIDPASVGKQMSMGCVRLNDREVEVVYELLGNDSTVEIR
jgi:hypothetical protein